MKKALYAGSFDPFTNGHKQIAYDAAEIFDEVTILVAINSQKLRRLNLDQTIKAIKETFKNTPNILVDYYSGFVVDYCNQKGIDYLIRGLRNTNDFMYEENIAKINAEINPQVKTVYLRTSNEIISSSMVWELHKNGKDVSSYLPKSVFLAMNAYKKEQL